MCTVFTGLLAGACTQSLDAGRTFVTASGQADAVIANLLSQREATHAEITYSANSYEYIAGAPSGACKTGGSSTDLAKERYLAELRKTKLALIKRYADQINALLSPSQAAQVVTTVADTVSKLASAASVPQATAVAAAASAVKVIAADLDATAREIAVRKIAFASDKAFQKVVSDLERSLKPVNEDLEAALKLWEQCEYAKVIYLRDNDPNSTKIEKEARYRAFHDTNLRLKQAIVGAEEAESLFRKVATLHTAIGNGTLSVVEAAKALQEATNRVVEIINAAKTLAKT